MHRTVRPLHPLVNPPTSNRYRYALGRGGPAEPVTLIRNREDGEPCLGNDPSPGRQPGGHRPTMRDVAALAGVGVMTVSRVVNGRGGVGAELAARVRQAIEQLDYQHNLTARNLRLTGQPTATIGVLPEDVANPPQAELLRAVEKVVSEHNCLVICA